MKVQSVWCATALANRVLPVPGGPYNNTPCNKPKPKHEQRCGYKIRACCRLDLPLENAGYTVLLNSEIVLHVTCWALSR